MRAGDLVRFRMNDYQQEWMTGLLIRYDKFTKVGEIVVGKFLFYAPGRLIQVAHRGQK